ncbi:serine hydrolase domain-containing protein [Aestuariivivens sediminicola]|uniref:serine hydrolase domain-containing protein n=1 Tax=Aestuariivivens sediminicola TaxID=2913560 RepID=UPI001F5A148C|nr:serine hydrolase [Aestuariivivens sediminicola]
MKLTFIFTLILLQLFLNLSSQNYDELKVNETIRVPYEPYNWETESIGNHNIEKDKLDTFLSKISEWENLQSVLVIKDNKLILEKYYKGCDKYSAFNTFSVTKSITSALIGIAIKQKLIQSENESIMAYFPEYADKINDDRKNNITIKHLLTMSGGLHPDKWWNPSIKYALLKAPVESKPGDKFLYYNALPHMLSAIISKATNHSIREYAETYLFRPLEINCAYWQKEEGYYSGRSGTYFTPRDLARLGTLYLQKGNVNNVQILDTLWIEKSFKNYADTDDKFFLRGHEVNQIGYGYLWWIMEANEKKYFAAYGAGDQCLLINPESNTIILITQHFKQSWFDKKEDLDLLEEFISIVDN